MRNAESPKGRYTLTKNEALRIAIASKNPY